LSDVRSRKFMQSLQIGARRLASSRSPCQDPLVTASDEFAGLAFGARIEDYAKFRLAYPPALFDAIDAALAPGLRRFAVDLGSGTGLSPAQLLGRFSRVAAVEPDPRMAAQIVPRQGLDVVVAKAEEVGFADGSVDLVTCGTAFHWMDGPRVLERAARWLD